MAERATVPDTQQGHEDTSRTLRRRGLVAGAAALIAGLAAAKVADPVAAGTDGDLVVGALTTANNTTTLNAAIASNPTLRVNNGFIGGDALADGIQGYATGQARAGVFGRNNSALGIGLQGIAPSGNAVLGESTAGNGNGVAGVANTGLGVFGQSNNYVGVFGNVLTAPTGGSGYGVFGATQAGSGYGVYGLANAGTGVAGVALGAGGVGVIGNNPSAGGGYGVAGIANNGDGVVGSTAILYGAGVYGSNSGVAGAYGGYFVGATVVVGDFVVNGNQYVTGSKSAAVPFADGSHRLVYCVEAPDSWFEDIGKAKLVGGKADVKIDADFAQIIHTDDYSVFLTPGGDCNGLYVTNQTATGFQVRELKGGASNLTFVWRLVAKRKDITASRLAKVDLPKTDKKATVKNVPTDANLPKAPELPEPRG